MHQIGDRQRRLGKHQLRLQAIRLPERTDRVVPELLVDPPLQRPCLPVEPAHHQVPDIIIPQIVGIEAIAVPHQPSVAEVRPPLVTAWHFLGDLQEASFGKTVLLGEQKVHAVLERAHRPPQFRLLRFKEGDPVAPRGMVGIQALERVVEVPCLRICSLHPTSPL